MPLAVSRSTLPNLWLLGTFRPRRAFDALQAMPAPAWGFRVVIAFNLTISVTTLLALHLLGRRLPPQRPAPGGATTESNA